MLPGRPVNPDHVIEGFDLFKVHNWGVERMRVRWVMVVGDSTEVCTPFEIGVLEEVLSTRQSQRSTVDISGRVRGEKFNWYTDTRSAKNKQRLFESDAAKVVEQHHSCRCPEMWRKMQASAENFCW